jgi:hypothetical protein
MPRLVIFSSASTAATNTFIGVQGYLVSQYKSPGAILDGGDDRLLYSEWRAAFGKAH